MLIQGLELVGLERNLLLWPYRINNEREAEMLYKTWNWDVDAEFRISIKKPGLQGLRP